MTESVPFSAASWPWLPVRSNPAEAMPGTSFSPPTEGNLATALFGGRHAMAAMRQAILSAKSFVYIADWMMAVDLPLVREAATEPVTLFDLLADARKRDVRVQVSLYDSVPVGSLDNGDEQAEKRLHEIPGIQVQTHRPGLVYSHHQKILVVDGMVAFLGGIDLAWSRWDTENHPVAGGSDRFPDKDFQNDSLSVAEQQAADPGWQAFQKAWKEWWSAGRVAVPPKPKPEPPSVGSLDWRKVYPRTPWQDVHLRFSGPAAKELARCYEQRWNFVDSQKYGGRAQLSPAPSASVLDGFAPVPWSDPTLGQLPSTSTARMQILRSVGPDTYGVATETSILDAYLSLIDRAQHHVYIENQFFVSNPTDQTNEHVQNQIAKHLLARVLDAISAQRPFRIDIVLPVHSWGDIRDFTTTSAPQRTGFHQNRSLCRDGLSLAGQISQTIVADRSRRGLSTLDAAGLAIETSKYLGIYCLRSQCPMPGNSAIPVGRWASSQVYVHTKLLVVDDTRIVLGSANLNDRSMLGDRDSEIAFLLEDGTLTDSVLADQPCAKGSLPFALRRRLWQDHWGSDSPDPVGDWEAQDHQTLATGNTTILESVFPYLPADHWRDIDVWNAALKTGPGWFGFGPPSDLAEAGAKLAGLHGAICLYPRQFLADNGLDSGGVLSNIYT